MHADYALNIHQRYGISNDDPDADTDHARAGIVSRVLDVVPIVTALAISRTMAEDGKDDDEEGEGRNFAGIIDA